MAEPAACSPDEDGEVGMTQYKILLADDDSGLRALMARRLSKLEGDLDQAEDGKEALSLLEANHYDLIVSDIYMPGATGLDILRAAREKDPHTQVVVVTAAATLENAIEALNNGAFGYMIKPFDHISVFDNTVRRALEFRRLMQENKRMAEAQKRRGDMLEDEVTDRIKQVQNKQRELMEIVSRLPNGVLVVDDQGRVSLSNPEVERLLALEAKMDTQPLRQFVDLTGDAFAESKVQIQIGEELYQCARYEMPPREDKERVLIIVQPVIQTSSLPTIELWRPLENALETAEWLKAQSHSGRQEAALDRMGDDLMSVAALLLELDPGLKDSPGPLERNQLSIPPKIKAQMENTDAGGQGEGDGREGLSPPLDRTEASLENKPSERDIVRSDVNSSQADPSSQPWPPSLPSEEG
jgi:DNA-binding response OmpR family regulator